MDNLIDCYLLSINELQDDKIFSYVLDLLPEVGLWNERKKHINDYYKIEDKKRSILTGLILKHIFDTNNIKYEDLRKNYYGKLYIHNIETVKFNISHCGDYVVCTIGNSESGVDIEKRINGLEIAKHFFTKYEYQKVIQGSSDMFTRIWTLKESYIKERGLGLSIHLNSFEVHPGRFQVEPNARGTDALMMLEKTTVKDDFERQFREFKLDEYYISICSKGQISENIRRISISQLL